MRSALTQIDGVSDIQTDPKASPTPICTFKLADASLDIKAKLNELAGTNEHIKGWSMAE